jgi:hypothetical protein
MPWISLLLGCGVVLVLLLRHRGKTLKDAMRVEVEATRNGFGFFVSAVRGVFVLMAVVLVLMVIYAAGLLLERLL